MYDEKGMPCIDEYKFLPNRKFRIDHYFPQVNLAIEEEGGVFINGSHCRPMRFCSDMEKYNLMTENGISLLRYQPRKIDHDQIKRVYDRLSLKQKV